MTVASDHTVTKVLTTKIKRLGRIKEGKKIQKRFNLPRFLTSCKLQVGKLLHSEFYRSDNS